MVLPAVRTSAGCRVGGANVASTVAVGPVQCTSCLAVLAALVRGAKKEQIQPHLQVRWDLILMNGSKAGVLFFKGRCMDASADGV